MAAGSAASHLPEPALEVGPPAASLAAREPCERGCDRAEAVDARAALAGALPCEVPGDARRLDQHAAFGGERDHDPGAEPAAVPRELGVEQRQLESRLRVEPA